LSNATAYTVYLRAVNALGFGTTSNPANTVTPAGVPAAPGIPTASLPATYGNTTAFVSWTAPSSNGSAITDYIVQYSSNSGGSWTTFADGTSTTTSTTVTGLSNGTAYVFRVAAVNDVNPGAYSSASNSVTPLFGKVPTPVVLDIAETTNSIPWCYNNYNDISQADGYVYNYYDYTAGQPPNDQNGSCHGWTGLGENVNRFTYVYVSKTGWANSDSIYLEETTNITTTTTPAPPVFTPAPPSFPPSFQYRFTCTYFDFYDGICGDVCCLVGTCIEPAGIFNNFETICDGNVN
jgi:titin